MVPLLTQVSWAVHAWGWMQPEALSARPLPIASWVWVFGVPARGHYFRRYRCARMAASRGFMGCAS